MANLVDEQKRKKILQEMMQSDGLASQPKIPSEEEQESQLRKETPTAPQAPQAEQPSQLQEGMSDIGKMRMAGIEAQTTAQEQTSPMLQESKDPIVNSLPPELKSRFSTLMQSEISPESVNASLAAFPSNYRPYLQKLLLNK